MDYVAVGNIKKSTLSLVSTTAILLCLILEPGNVFVEGVFLNAKPQTEVLCCTRQNNYRHTWYYHDAMVSQTRVAIILLTAEYTQNILVIQANRFVSWFKSLHICAVSIKKISAIFQPCSFPRSSLSSSSYL